MLKIQKSRKIYANIMALLPRLSISNRAVFLPLFQISRFDTVIEINEKLGNLPLAQGEAHGKLLMLFAA
ncbi:hypothetical protein [Pectinatus frisingensis]|uniref:hypothetical protein n=1 Tax=Pectinatus frisingensis TaxID=865 RepID=UPI001E5095FD|nr:hypothetical protein [Pectinatus frisingensis]